MRMRMLRIIPIFACFAVVAGLMTFGVFAPSFASPGSASSIPGSSGPASDTAHPASGGDSTSAAARTVNTPTAFPSGASGRTTVIERMSRVGVFGPSHAISVANLTVTPGVYLVRFNFEARADSAYSPATIKCGLVDNNGVDHFIFDDSTPLTAGRGWATHTETTTFALADVTLGVKCQPAVAGLYRASFRNVTFWVERIETRG